MTWDKLPNGKADWGVVTPGLADVTTMTGLAVAGAATVGYFGGRVDLSSTDLADDGYLAWLGRLEQAVPSRPASPFLTMLQHQSAFDAVGTIEAEAGPLLKTARGTTPALLYPSPVATADVVLATTGDPAATRLGALVEGSRGRSALAAAGWRVGGLPPGPGVDTSVILPPTDNLPEPGVLDALRAVVSEAS
jgi:hypothetical protein